MLEANDVGRVPRFGVALTWTMTRLTTLPLRSLMFCLRTSVWILREASTCFFVTSFAGFCAYILSGINRSLIVAGFSRPTLLRNCENRRDKDEDDRMDHPCNRRNRPSTVVCHSCQESDSSHCSRNSDLALILLTTVIARLPRALMSLILS